MPVPALDQAPYTLRNLPYGVVSTRSDPNPRCAVAIGHHAIDLSTYAKEGRLSGVEPPHQVSWEATFAQPALNTFAGLPRATRTAVRRQIQDDLRAENVPTASLIALRDVTNHLPMTIGGYSDFYTSLDHCKNCSGELTTSAIPKNWFFAPSVYNSRVSSVVPTPTDIHRPKNVSFAQGVDSEPTYGPCRKMDFELEMGYWVSQPVAFGDSMPIGAAREHIFGFVLLNDWSARDHQVFEMRPLGPFHAKGFGTSISNWIVPMEALEPFSCAPHLAQDPPPFPHLTWPSTAAAASSSSSSSSSSSPSAGDDGALDIKLRVSLVRDGQTHVLATSNLKYLYWTPYQQLAHHAASGCGMQTGDLVGTGTISGSGRDARGHMCELGCLYEAERTKTAVLPARGAPGPYEPGYLEDGDEIVLDGWCEDDSGEVVLGFGECRGRILPPK